MRSKVKTLIVLTLFFTSLLPAPASAYDEVQIEKVVPLVDKKAYVSVFKLDPHKQMWVLNKTNMSLQLMDLDGKVRVSLASGKKKLFKSPIDFGFLRTGSIVVADEGVGKILILDPKKEEDEEANTVSLDWKQSTVLKEFTTQAPAAIAVSDDDIIAVGSASSSLIEIYSEDGVLLHKLSAPQNQPIKGISSLVFAKDGTLWALDGGKGVLHRFSADRKWLGGLDGLESAQSVTVDEYGFAYVVLGKGKWKEVNPDGKDTGTYGTKGKNPGQLTTPTGAALLSKDRLMVADAGNARIQIFRVTNKNKQAPLYQQPASRVQVRMKSTLAFKPKSGVFLAGDEMLVINNKDGIDRIDKEGKVLSSWKKQKGAGSLSRPSYLATDSNGKIWVSDQNEHNLKLVSDAGEVMKAVGQKGKKEGSLQNPSLFNVRADGSFVVVDRDESRVQVMSPEGLFLFRLASPAKNGQFERIAGVAANDDFIAVMDSGRKSLMFFESSGKFSFEIANKEGKAPFWMDVAGLSKDSENRFYVLDKGSKRIRIFNAKAQFLADFSADGEALFCGGDHNVVVMGEKGSSIFGVHLVPKAVQNVQAVDEAGSILVSWDKNLEANEYNVYRSTGNGVFTFLEKTDSTSIVDSKVIPALTYTYAVAGSNKLAYTGDWGVSKPVKASRRTDVSLISIDRIAFNPVYTAAFKYYVEKPVGEIVIQNNDDRSYRNIKIALSLKKYTDFATENIVTGILAGETMTVPVTLTLNEKVLELAEDTPVQVDVKVSYFEDNNEKSISQNAPITLLSRNAISWADKARAASFITPRDTPIAEFSRAAIRSFIGPLKASTVGKPLAKALLFYESINALGISYVPDPKTPFSEVSGKPEVMDYVQFPRETLRRKTGDCDDTTALLSALLESIGVQTALVDTPGHIFLMVNLEETDIEEIGLPAERFVEYNGNYWLPIETTQLGKNFLSAWQTAISEVKAAQEKNQFEFVQVSEAWKKYPPVSIIEEDKMTPAFPQEKVEQVFPALLAQLQDERYNNRVKTLKELIKADPVNHMLQVQLGLVHVQGGKPAVGKEIFNSLLKEDEALDVQASARNNLGNMAYLDGKYEEAIKYYTAAAQNTPDDGGILINHARTLWKMGDNDGATQLLVRASQLLPEWREFASDIPAELLPK